MKLIPFSPLNLPPDLIMVFRHPRPVLIAAAVVFAVVALWLLFVPRRRAACVVRLGGPINARANQRAFDVDPDLPLLLSLENFDSESGQATKAAIFRERTIHRRNEALTAANPKEALLVSLNENRNPVVQIYRYVTGGSFDAYMWQTLETKAKFIALVMSGDLTIRRLEDLDSAALTYAEVKAIASGNPLVIEKAQVDAELMRLTRLRSAHSEGLYRIRGERRRAEEDAGSTGQRLANLRLDLRSRAYTSGDRFSIEIDGEIVTNRGIAGELLLRRAEKLRSRYMEETQVGRFAGFSLVLRTGFDDSADVILRGHNSYAARVTDTALGTIRSLEATLHGLEERGEKLEQEGTNFRKRASELEARIGQHFEHEEHFQELRKRQSAIADQLDLTKNQAATQLDAEPGPEQANAFSEKATPVEGIKHVRKTAMRV